MLCQLAPSSVSRNNCVMADFAFDVCLSAWAIHAGADVIDGPEWCTTGADKSELSPNDERRIEYGPNRVRANRCDWDPIDIFFDVPKVTSKYNPIIQIAICQES